MKTDELDYNLPAELIAQWPSQERGGSRLLVLQRAGGAILDRKFADITDYLQGGDCLVLNDTKVLPAKFYIQKENGAKTEALFLAQSQPGQWTLMLKNARRLRPGQKITLLDRTGSVRAGASMVCRDQQGRWIMELLKAEPAEKLLDEIGFAPLPPYIRRTESDRQYLEKDLDRYQTVYAQRPGAVAAPTAGLHFDRPLLEKIEKMGVLPVRITLDVGEGTFKPVKTQNLEDHLMHTERFQISPQAAEVINHCRGRGRRVIAVGTTAVRTLESSVHNGLVTPAAGQTNLFIRPGFKFQAVDGMITNFHLPRSTLIALVAAFAGLEQILRAYRHAIEKQYRFYSYGDAMLIV